MDQSRRVAQFAIGISVALAIVFAALLLFGRAPKQCPNWHLTGARGSSLWVPFYLFMGLILSALVRMAARWDQLVRKIIDRVDYLRTIPVPHMLLIIVLMGCGASQFPWIVLVSKCWS